MEVDVEILDVNDEEARMLLLSIDPLAVLAETHKQIHQQLMELTPCDSDELRAAWQAAAEKSVTALPAPLPPGSLTIPEQFLVLITCRDEQHQVELLERLGGEELECRALLS